MADLETGNIVDKLNNAINERLDQGKEFFTNKLKDFNTTLNGRFDQFINGLEALRFDPDKMSVAYLAIYDGFKKLSETIRQINVELFGEYITDNQLGTKGSAIDVETLSDTLASLWHGAVDVRLDDFVAHYQEWSEVMNFVDAVNKKYVEEAEATYGENFKNNPFARLFTYTGTKTTDIGVTLNNNDRKAAMEVLKTNLNQSQVDEMLCTMSEEQVRYIDQKAQEYASENISRYNDAMNKYINEGEALPKWIINMNPIYKAAFRNMSDFGGAGEQ